MLIGAICRYYPQGLCVHYYVVSIITTYLLRLRNKKKRVHYTVKFMLHNFKTAGTHLRNHLPSSHSPSCIWCTYPCPPLGSYHRRHGRQHTCGTPGCSHRTRLHCTVVSSLRHTHQHLERRQKEEKLMMMVLLMMMMKIIIMMMFVL